jgi:hypothetical protein
MALRLRGLADGKFIANKNTKPQASYDYKTILYTFKICKSKIKEYMINNQIKIKDETHKINLIMMFVENEINDVVLRLQNAKKSEEKTENLELENQFNNGAEYQKKETKINKKLTELW